MSKKTDIIKIPFGIPPRVIVCGDMGRVLKVSALLRHQNTEGQWVPGGKEITHVREYLVHQGFYENIEILVASHGVGCGGASVIFEELIKAGAKYIVRAGSCGSFHRDLMEGSLIIATGAVREDGVSDRLIDPSYPAVCSHQVINALLESAKSFQATDASLIYNSGIVTTIGHFYDGPLGNKNKIWSKSGVLGIEMELSVLLIIASLRGVHAGGVFTVDNYVLDREELEKERDVGTYNPYAGSVDEGITKMINVSLNAMKYL